MSPADQLQLQACVARTSRQHMQHLARPRLPSAGAGPRILPTPAATTMRLPTILPTPAIASMQPAPLPPAPGPPTCRP
jgi:hypothetical protein